jgi:two-component system, LytTR family, sensor histidine kinase AlgZ
MITVEGVRCLHTGYWFRVAAVSLAAGLVITALLISFGLTSSLALTLPRAIVHAVCMGGLTGSTLPRVRRRLEHWSAAARWAFTIPTLLVLAVVGTALACSIIALLGLSGHEPFGSCFTSDLRINALLSLTLGVAMILYETQRRRLDVVTLELRTQQLEHERASKMALEARLAALEARLQPHFLFNTLNAISALIREDPEQAERTVERLAALLRFALDATERGVIPLGHEVKIVTDYLEIERTRLGERLTYSVEVDPDVLGYELPPLALQTLVENSVKHAIAPRPGGGRIRVAGAARGDRLVLSVWDDGPGFTSEAIRPGHGLDNLQGRLAGRFGPEATLHVARDEGGTLVTIAVPCSAGARP